MKAGCGGQVNGRMKGGVEITGGFIIGVEAERNEEEEDEGGGEVPKLVV